MASLEELGRRRGQGDPTAHKTLGGELCTGSEVQMLHSNTVTASINEYSCDTVRRETLHGV